MFDKLLLTSFLLKICKFCTFKIFINILRLRLVIGHLCRLGILSDRNLHILGCKASSLRIHLYNYRKHSYCYFLQRICFESFYLRIPLTSLENMNLLNNSKNKDTFHLSRLHFHCRPRDTFSLHRFLKKKEDTSGSHYSLRQRCFDPETCKEHIYYPL